MSLRPKKTIITGQGTTIPRIDMGELSALVLYTESAGKGRPDKLIHRLEKELGRVHEFEDTARGVSQATAAADREDLDLVYLDLDSAHAPGVARMLYAAQPYIRIVLLAEGDKEEALRELHAVAVIPRSPSREQLRETLPSTTLEPATEPEVEVAENIAEVISMPRPAEPAEAAYAESGMPLPEPATEPEPEVAPEPAPEPELAPKVGERRAPRPAIDWKRRGPMVAAALMAALLVFGGALATGTWSGGERAALMEDKGFGSAEEARAYVLGMMGGGEAEAPEEEAVPEPEEEEKKKDKPVPVIPDTPAPPPTTAPAPAPEPPAPAPQPAPSVYITGDTPVMLNSSGTYEAHPSGVEPFTYSWGSRKTSMVFTKTGQQSVNVTVTDGNGNHASATYYVQVI